MVADRDVELLVDGSSARGPGPGTLETKPIETIDNDVSAMLGGALDAARTSSPSPGTRVTATIETVDNGCRSEVPVVRITMTCGGFVSTRAAPASGGSMP